MVTELEGSRHRRDRRTRARGRVDGGGGPVQRAWRSSRSETEQGGTSQRSDLAGECALSKVVPLAGAATAATRAATVCARSRVVILISGVVMVRSEMTSRTRFRVVFGARRAGQPSESHDFLSARRARCAAHV